MLLLNELDLMIIVLLTWLSIFFIFFSFGDFLVFFYNKISKRNESYGVTNTFILGMCFTLIPLSITSLWLPSNHYIMFSYIVLGVVYWIVRKQHLKALLHDFRKEWSIYSSFQRFLFAIMFLSFSILVLYQQAVADACFYHYQLTNWNESYRTVPGIANIESRMGFNSAYSLLSAIFTFRFITGEQSFLLQSLLALLICFSIIRHIISSKYDIRYIIALFLYFLLCFYNLLFLTNSSTDIVPTLCVFYIVTCIAIKPNLLKRNYLLLFFVPICLITFKFSTLPFSLLSLFILYSLYKQRNFRSLNFCICISVIVILFWCIRNVLITGYLIYPIYQIDLFSFDWKVPLYVAKEESRWIGEYPKIALVADYLFLKYFISTGGVFYYKSRFIIVFSTYSLVLFSSLSPFIVGIAYLKKKKVSTNLYMIFFILAIYITFGLISAPDFRFIAGAIYAMVVLEFIFIFKIIRKQNYYTQNLWRHVYTLAVFLLFIISVKSVYNGYFDVRSTGIENRRPYYSILYTPYSSAAMFAQNTEFGTYKMCDSISIYMAKDNPFFTYDKLPATGEVTENGKWQPIETVEARGDKLENGFRPKPVTYIK